MRLLLWSKLFVPFTLMSVARAAPEEEAQAVGVAEVQSPVSQDKTARNLEKIQGELSHELETVRQELDQVVSEVRAANARSVAWARAYVRLAHAGWMPVSGGFEALLAHAAQLQRCRHGLERDTGLERQLSQRRIDLHNKLKALEQRRSAVVAEQRALAEAVTLAAQNFERDAAFEQVFLAGAREQEGRQSGLATLLPRTGFRHLRGKLPFPVAGRVDLRPVRLRTARVGGVELACDHGAIVRAVYSGRIAFADKYADYGKAVIIDHGGSGYTLTGLMSSLEVRVGDSVRAGARLGTAGDQEGTGRLYFEVRIGPDTVDTAEWLGLTR